MDGAAASEELVATWRDKFRAFEEISTPDAHPYDVVHMMEPCQAEGETYDESVADGRRINHRGSRQRATRRTAAMAG